MGVTARTIVFFWASTIAAVVLLGTLVATARSDPGPWGMFLIGSAVVGLLATLTVAGRIAFVAERLKRLAKHR